MKLLQKRNKKWYLDKQLIFSRGQHLGDIIFCGERLDYSTMNDCYMVMENYEEMSHKLLLCYTAFLRFYENYSHDPHYAWINKDADSSFLGLLYGERNFYIGEIETGEWKAVREEVRSLGGRTLVIEKDWYIRFRDELVMACY